MFALLSPVREPLRLDALLTRALLTYSGDLAGGAGEQSAFRVLLQGPILTCSPEPPESAGPRLQENLCWCSLFTLRHK